MTHRLLFILLATALGYGCATRGPGAGDKPLLLATYYTWYSTGDGAHGAWSSWGTGAPSLYAPDGCDPEQVLFPPHIREISSCAYPLIGPYDSDDPDVVRWHIRLAKAAGIDAFLVDWWGPAGWQTVPGLTRTAFEDVVLPIAAEEDFKVALFDETAQFADDFDKVKQWAAEYLGRFKDHPAYLHIGGKPVYAVYQVPFDPRLSAGQAEELRAHVEQRTGPVYWILDKMAWEKAGGEKRLTVPDAFLELDWPGAFMMYGTFSVHREHTFDALAPQYRHYAARVRAAGRDVVLPVHPGHNNSKLQTEPYVIPRDEGDTLRGYLRAAEAAHADAVLVTSFNEWPETTNVEPAVTWENPYRYLEILAEWKRKRFRAPDELPRTLRFGAAPERIVYRPQGRLPRGHAWYPHHRIIGPVPHRAPARMHPRMPGAIGGFR